MKKTLKRLKANGFEVVELGTAEQAKDYLLEAIPAGATVGVAGSVTVRETGVLPALIERGHEVFSHWDVQPEEAPATHQKAHRADVYLTSVNALSKRGELILIDGTGNRVAAVANGPKQVYFIVSQNKWVDGGYGAAVARGKKDACPKNARRLHLHTPCGDEGKCDSDECGDDCMCRITLAVDRVPRNRKMTLLFVKEKLGY